MTYPGFCSGPHCQPGTAGRGADAPAKAGFWFLNWEMSTAFGAMVYGLGIFLGTVQTPDQRAYRVFSVSALCADVVYDAAHPAHCQCVAVRRHFSGLRHPLQGLAGHPHGCLQRVGVRGHLLHCVHLCHEHDVRQLITSSKLTTVAESDLNTRLHNRNAYENRLRDYPLRCSNSLTCVYIDVNGLHELNNTYGHEEGDKMLRTVACILREIFGEEDSYRIGGDEFVAFALDSPDTELNENIEQFVRQVEEAGYSVAVGTAPTARAALTLTLSSKRRSSGCIWTKADITNSCGAAPKNEHSAGKTPAGAVLFCALIFLFPVVRGTIYCN